MEGWEWLPLPHFLKDHIAKEGKVIRDEGGEK